MFSQNGHTQSSKRALEGLAALYGVQTGYRDSLGRRRESPPESVAMVLRALGADVAGWSELEAATRVREAELRSQMVEPVVVAWEGVLPTLAVRPPAGSSTSLDLTLTLEDGEERHWQERRTSLETMQHVGSTGTRPGLLPFGYHHLRLHAGNHSAEATVISAPRRCWAPPRGPERAWGVFAPLYALRGEGGWGAADVADLETLRDRVGEAGGSTVATLPLLAAYLDRPFEPAPYSPVSRMFWNEFYVSVDRVAGWDRCHRARELSASRDMQGRLARLAAGPMVDYRAAMAAKRSVLEELSRCFFATADATKKDAFLEYLDSNPELMEYASFRAAVETAGEDWRSWPTGPQVGRPVEGAPRPKAADWVAGSTDSEQYHAFCQWQMGQQMARLSGVGPGAGGLFLDLPVGVHPGGFDTWRWPESFVREMSIGAPPDSFFARGQNWDSPPLHPQRVREQGHRYFARCVRHHARHARYLRVDHVMALHRLFWIPPGAEPTEGVYVTYPSEELYAVLCLESHRHQAAVIGEDLGTVPVGTRTAMRRHGVLGTWVLQSSLRPRAEQPLRSVPRHVVAGLNTHDMYPFTGFARGDDVRARVEMGSLDQEAADRQIAARRQAVARLEAWLPVGPGSNGTRAGRPSAALFDRVLAYLAASPAVLVLVSLDDLLHETRPQNLPGTGPEQGNWRRKLASSPAGIRKAVARAAVILRGP
ncbi:MAG: 4-alpha-glucanotransferase [Actinobacteria bacterium RBG_16_64_13]|nr:MAG: 4-alpha-glucanotransferase [Actinobacteria bacterium RBG_16_64_13]